MKKFIAILITVLTIGGIILFTYFSNRTVKNEEQAVGNTPGNLYNGGLFCENDGKIYFSNHRDRGALYVMDSDLKNFKKLYDDNCSYINVTNHYVVYVRDNHKRNTAPGQFFNFNTTGLYRLDKKNGRNIKQLYGKPAGLTSLKGNTVYYQHYNADEGLRFHKIGLDGSGDEELSEEQIAPASFVGNLLYYNGEKKEHNIHAMDLGSHAVSTVFEENCYNITASGQYLYYLSLSNHYAIARVGLDGGNPEIIVNERCSFFNISQDGNYLYYQVDGGDNNRLCRMDLTAMESETIRNGDFNSIHVTSQYVFFREFEKEDFYYFQIPDGAINIFQPQALED